MSKALEGMHYCKEHQGNHSHYATENCEVCRLRAEVVSLKEQNALLTVQKEEVMRAWADALIEEIDAIPCRYHGDPSYDHDAYWMKGAVKDLIGKMLKWPPIPVKDRYIPDSECSQGKCANPTTGCFGKCYIAKHPEWPNVSLPPALLQQVKSEDDDTALLNAIQENSWDLVSRTLTSGDDCEIGWQVIEHHMAKPYERVIGENFQDDARAAIRAAMSAQENKS